MENRKCPICGSDGCEYKVDYKYLQIKCKEGFDFFVDESIERGNELDVIKKYNIIYSIMIRNPNKIIGSKKFKYIFYLEDTSLSDTGIEEQGGFNIFELLKDYPNSFMEKVDRSLINLYYYFYEINKKIIYLDDKKRKLYFSEAINSNEKNFEYQNIVGILTEMDYIKPVDPATYILTSNGWKRISELIKHETEVKQGFIAMEFSSRTSNISLAFKNAINKCGYIPRKIDEKEHNNQIVPEILFEISKSKFLVVDVTYPNYGAYYEAGYAEGLGKQVIVCCRKEEFNSEEKSKRPHFDIAQKSTIVWEDEEDLEKRLFKRIEATIGLNL